MWKWFVGSFALLCGNAWAAPTIQWASSPYVFEDNPYLVPSFTFANDRFGTTSHFFKGPVLDDSDPDYVSYYGLLLAENDGVAWKVFVDHDVQNDEWYVGQYVGGFDMSGTVAGADVVVHTGEFQSFLVPEPAGLAVLGISPLLLRRGSRLVRCST